MLEWPRRSEPQLQGLQRVLEEMLQGQRPWMLRPFCVLKTMNDGWFTKTWKLLPSRSKYRLGSSSEGSSNAAQLEVNATMAMSRSARITLLLTIDIFFFFVELIVGEHIMTLFTSSHH
jgi:hypothetical protein